MPVAALALAAMLLATPSEARDLPKIVSLNTCTDQLVLALADPEQILGLSPYARDPARSFGAERAKAFPTMSGNAEDVLVARPDLVLAGFFSKRETREFLKSQGMRIAERDTPQTIAGVRREIVEIGALIGQPERAAAGVAAIDAAIARAHAARRDPPLTVLPLQRRGWVSGRASLMTALVEVVGLVNAGAAIESDSGRIVRLEEIVAMKPDLLLLSGSADAVEDQGAALLEHPALAAVTPKTRRIVLPERLTVCAGPMLAEAIDRLVAEVAKLR